MSDKTLDEKKGEEKKSKGNFYSVLHAIAYNGKVYRPSYKAGKKIVPADIVEMPAEVAKGFGKEYLKKLDKK